MGWHGKPDEDPPFWPDGTPLKVRLVFTFCFLLFCGAMLAYWFFASWFRHMVMNPSVYAAPVWLKPIVKFFQF